jgi:hypothetical protein
VATKRTPPKKSSANGAPAGSRPVEVLTPLGEEILQSVIAKTNDRTAAAKAAIDALERLVALSANPDKHYARRVAYGLIVELHAPSSQSHTRLLGAHGGFFLGNPGDDVTGLIRALVWMLETERLYCAKYFEAAQRDMLRTAAAAGTLGSGMSEELDSLAAEVGNFFAKTPANIARSVAIDALYSERAITGLVADVLIAAGVRGYSVSASSMQGKLPAEQRRLVQSRVDSLIKKRL